MRIPCRLCGHDGLPTALRTPKLASNIRTYGQTIHALVPVRGER